MTHSPKYIRENVLFYFMPKTNHYIAIQFLMSKFYVVYLRIIYCSERVQHEN